MKAVDPKVHDLAVAWLSDAPARSLWAQTAAVTSLARAIQTAIEDWCDEQESGREKGDDDGVEYGHPGDRLRGLE